MVERRAAELRAAPGRRIIGRAMSYGAEARVRHPDGRILTERFAAFAFADYLASGAATLLNLEHDEALTVASTAGETRGRGALYLRDHPAGLDLEARLPPGDVFDSVLALIGSDVGQTSVEFRALQDVVAGDRRVVQIATLPAVAVVRAGAYGAAGTVETRRRRTVQARVDYGKEYSCECSGPACSRAVFEAGSFKLGDETLAVAGQYQQPVASVSGGGLRLAVQDEGLAIDLDLPDPEQHQAVRALIEAAAVAPVLARPLIDRRTAVSTEDGDTRRYTSAPIRAIILAASDKTEGWEPLEFEEQRAAPRRHWWL